MTNEDFAAVTHTYQIHEQALADLQKQVNRLSKIAEKLGLRPFRVSIGEPELKERAPLHGVKRYARMFPITLTGQRPVLNGWSLIAKLSHTEHGNIIGRPQGSYESPPLPVKYRDCKPNCDHCNTNRQRNDTFLFVNNESGDIKQIGSTCFEDYFGHPDPHTLLSLWNNMLKLDEWVNARGPDYEEDDMGLGGGGGSSIYDLDTVIQVSAAVIRTQGRYYSFSNPDEYGLTTKDHVQELLRRPQRNEKKTMPHEIINHDDVVKAKAVTEWLTSKTSATTDYVHNLMVLAKSGVIDLKQLGLAVSASAAYEREVMREQKEAEMIANSQHLGEIKGKLTGRQVVFNGMASSQNQWGTTYFCKMTDVETGAQLVWKTSSPLLFLSGQTYTINATIKDHSEFNGIKQTEIIRVACPDLKVIEAMRDTPAYTGTPDAMKYVNAQLRKVSNINTINGAHETILQEVTQAAVYAINDSRDDSEWRPALDAVLKAGADPNLNNRKGDVVRSPLDMALYYLDDPSRLAPVFLDHMQQAGVDMATVDTIISRDDLERYYVGGLAHEQALPAIAILEQYGMPVPGTSPYEPDPAESSPRPAAGHEEIVHIQQEPVRPEARDLPSAALDSVGDSLPFAQLGYLGDEPAPDPATDLVEQKAKPVKDSEMSAFFSMGF